ASPCAVSSPPGSSRKPPPPPGPSPAPASSATSHTTPTRSHSVASPCHSNPARLPDHSANPHWNSSCKHCSHEPIPVGKPGFDASEKLTIKDLDQSKILEKTNPEASPLRKSPDFIRRS